MMTQTPPSPLHVGLDVAKLTLQADLAGRSVALANTPAGHRSLLAHLQRLQAKTGRPCHVVCEGTGGYERAVVRALQAEAVPVSVHNAARVRAFARARGRLAKTDALDAAVLSAFGAAMQPESDTSPSEAEAALAALAARRDQLKEMVALEARREEHHEHATVKREAALLRKQLAAHLQKIEAEIAALLTASAEVGARSCSSFLSESWMAAWVRVCGALNFAGQASSTGAVRSFLSVAVFSEAGRC